MDMERSRDAARFWCGALVVILLVAGAAGPGIGPNGTPGATGPTGSVSLLSHLPYPPGERDQGGVATCWVWAGTAVLEIAHSVQDGVRDPLSVQFVDSNFNGGAGPAWAGSAGTVSDFAAFHGSTGFTVPRSNANADYQDAAHAGWCNENRRAWVAASSIETTPHYPITNITVREVPTTGSPVETIARIKALLDQGRAVHLTWRNLVDIAVFQSFWNNEGDEAVYDPVTWLRGATVNGVSHQMCVVGYDDTDPANRYWLVLNSWGTANGRRPNGTFRMSMDLDYTSGAATWTTLDVTFGPISTAATGAGPEPAMAGVPGGAGVPTDTDPDSVRDDVDGNGRLEAADAVLFFNRVSWLAANEPVARFDYNGNGRIDFADVVRLFNHL
jgi:PKD repeat protein